MRRIFTIIIIIALLCLIGLCLYLFYGKGTAQNNTKLPSGQSGSLPVVVVGSSTTSTVVSNLPDYIGQASIIIGNLPTSTLLALGTARGTVQVENFYLSNPPVVEGGDVVIKQTSNYLIVYNPLENSFWLGVTGSPFATWQSAAENDFLSTLNISQGDACKLNVTSGVVYSPGNPNDGKSFPLSFCTGEAFQDP